MTAFPEGKTVDVMLEPIDPEILERRYTLEEYLALPEGPPYYELDDGVLVVKSTHGTHGLWMGRIFAYLDTWCRHHGGYVSLDVGTLPGGDRNYIPDVVYIAPGHMDRYVDGRIHGVPDLAVEVFNRRGAGRNRVHKFNAYRAFGLEWYWLISYDEQVFEEYHLEAGAYVRTAEAGPGDEFRPRALPGLVIPVDDVGR